MIAERCKSNKKFARLSEAQTILPITEKLHEVMTQFSNKEIDEETILKDFSNYRKTLPPVLPTEYLEEALMSSNIENPKILSKDGKTNSLNLFG